MVFDISFRLKDFYDNSIIVRVPKVPEANYVSSREQRACYVTNLSANELISKLRVAYPLYLFQLEGTVSSDNHYSVPGSIVYAPKITA